MANFARVDNGLVAELFTTPTGFLITDCFSADIPWEPCDGYPDIAPGWIATLDSGVWSFAEHPPPSGPTVIEQAVTAISDGVQIVSTGTPTLNGTYPCDESAQRRMNAIALYIKVNSTFPGGVSSYQLKDIAHATHTFVGTAQFNALWTAFADYVAALDRVIDGTSVDLPTQPVTIV